MKRELKFLAASALLFRAGTSPSIAATGIGSEGASTPPAFPTVPGIARHSGIATVLTISALESRINIKYGSCGGPLLGRVLSTACDADRPLSLHTGRSSGPHRVELGSSAAQLRWVEMPDEQLSPMVI